MADGMLALTWNNHSSTFSKTISSLRVKEQYTDVTITCEGKFYQVHKFVLATCSEYFEKIFQETPCKHPVVVLRDVSCDELEALLNYMYIGSVSVAQSDLSRLIKVAELFQIKGLAVPDDPPKGSDVDSDLANSDSSRDRKDSYYGGSGSETNRTNPYSKGNKNSRTVVDSYSPHPKRMRGLDNLSLPEPGLPLGRDNDLQNKSDAISNSSSNDQFNPFGVHIKEEVHDVIDSESESQDSKLEAPIIPKTEVLDVPPEEEPYVQEDSELASPYLAGSDSQDVPPDGQAVAQAVLGQHAFTEDLLSLPGPSDAQEWYSEGDASGGDGSQEMLPLEASQQQAQRMVVPETSQPTETVLEGSKISPQMIPESSHYTVTIVEGSNIKQYSCIYCSFTTQNKGNMVRHTMVHTGEKPHECPYCSSTFSQKENLKVHIRKHTGEKPFACSLCPYRGARKDHLQKHMLSNHKGIICKSPS